MTLKTMNHALICLEDKNYNRRVLLRGALLARKSGYTFEVLFFYSPTSRYTIFNLLNIAESKNLSKRLGAIKFTLKKTENEQSTAKELVTIANNNKAKEVIMSGAQQRSRSENPFWRRVFFFDKFNYIFKNMPDIVLVLINHRVCNPFEKGEYKNGRKGYLVEGNDVKTPYMFSDKPSSEKHIAGLFFQVKNTDDWNGIFAFIRNGRVVYAHIQHGKASIKNKLSLK